MNSLSVSVQRLAEAMKLKEITSGDYHQEVITISDVNRIGLQMAGFFESFPAERIQIIGWVEYQYFQTLSKGHREWIANRFMAYNFPCLLFSRNLEPFPELLEAAQRYQRPIYVSELTTSTLINRIINFLDEELAPRIVMHGVLVDLNGVGVLIFGKSGIGKSETALELVKRGHRFVADDAIEIYKINESTLEGRAPELIKNFMEIRGIGILDIAQLYGIGSVRERKVIDFVVQLDDWKPDSEYDRLGIEQEMIDILGVQVPRISIPVKPGRNLAVILEAAARNHRMREMGFNAAEELDKRLQDSYRSAD